MKDESMKDHRLSGSGIYEKITLSMKAELMTNHGLTGSGIGSEIASLCHNGGMTFKEPSGFRIVYLPTSQIRFRQHIVG